MMGRVLILLAVALGALAALRDPWRAKVLAQATIARIAPPQPPEPAMTDLPVPSPIAEAILAAAERQVGVTLGYDPAYVAIAFPGGDVPSATGVCSDVVIRALREGLGLDLQLAVNRDMKRAFAAYPALWGLTRPDPNIDHRRVPNLETLLTRAGAALPVSSDADSYLPGDIVSWRLPGNRPHVGLVSRIPMPNGTPMILHNIGAGARIDDILFRFEIAGHYRLTEKALANLGLASR
ncbi:DUF1287 domain-containing protein [Frigidibacter sp. RF13]|uniref:DUF1287 domain-containing protein n=1 Tax=Frigidibacter sp. RF13 TaxID=2997340 RepID=UPI0022707B38|nr:DUF1287 domain-containing protein [Frigidibacter sp. RF13]MCY1128761.1 DUF1287 domain-containing protein [Frigidibacter sp. RF13]